MRSYASLAYGILAFTNEHGLAEAPKAIGSPDPRWVYLAAMEDRVEAAGDQRDVYAELTRLNDQLLAMQHELEKKNSALERLAYYDTLTGLLNRRALLEKLDEWLIHVRRYDDPLSVVMVDLDNFKQVNDTLGHRVGDRVLSDVASLMSRSLRRTDFCGRYGGEEFLVILPHTDAAGATVMAERLRSTIEGTPMRAPSAKTFRVTASFGTAQWYSGDTEDLLVGRADSALYKAKRLGRNRVEIAPLPTKHHE